MRRPTVPVILFHALVNLPSLILGATLKYSAQDNAVSYLPGTGWYPIQAPGAYDDGKNGATGQFLLGDTSKGLARFKFPTASTTFELWGWQRSDGGKYSLSIDGGKAITVDYNNATSTGDDSPVKLYSKTGLSNKIHEVVIKNAFDASTGRYGQMNMDHFVLKGAKPTSTHTPAPPSSTPTKPPKATAMNLRFPAPDSSVAYQPSDGQWITIQAPGAQSVGQFLVADQDKGQVTFKSPVASTSFEYWGWQRSDGGNSTLSIDGGKPVVVNYYNKTSTGDDGPVRLFKKTGLSNKAHTVVIKNTLDKRVNHYGQLTVDHFRIHGIAPVPSPPNFPKNPKMAESPSRDSYHVDVSLGADSPANGGDGKTVSVLFDTGATGVWVTWVGCDQPECQERTPYTPSSQQFHNFSISDDISYGDGGPDSTMTSWRVNDTVTLGSATIARSTFGAAYHLPGSQPFDGNFGMGKSYCNGKLCASYPSFVENMYDKKIITAPVLSFYELADNDEHAVAVKSMAQIGGVDRRKFKGSIDWTFVNSQSQWQIPHSLRFVTKSKGSKTIDATDLFTHPILTLDTGDPGLLGLPTNDWNTLVRLTGAKSDTDGNWRFPCDSTMTWNFHGSQGRNYTFDLARRGTADSRGLCEALANDAGPTSNWITGAPFLNQYYVAWNFGQHGVGSSMGFAKKNLDLAAATMLPVVGVA